LKISILDQSPISSNQTAQDALLQSMKLAQAGEKLGYTRYWIAEHHDLSGLACSAPEVMLSYIGAHTSTIRLGAGAVLLPHYSPYKVAEVYNMLATLFPGRMDLGIGRAPGGSAEATEALSGNFLQRVWKMPELVSDLLHFLENDFPEGHLFSKVQASPLPPVPAVTWLLGTSKKSAILAAENGMNYAFGQFMSDKDGAEIIGQYRENFKPRKDGQKPQVIITISAFCGETQEKAEEIALSSLIWSIQKGKGEGSRVPSFEEAKNYVLNDLEKEKILKMKEKILIGNPQQVKERLVRIQNDCHADEIMIVTITHDFKDKIQSYKLIAEEVLS